MEASHGIAVLVLALLSTTTMSSIYATTASCAATAFIKSTCNPTTNPSLCNKICLPNAENIKCDLQSMSMYVMKEALGAATNSSTVVSKMSKEKGLNPSDKEGIDVCIEEVDDSVDEIKQSLSELEGLKNSTSDQDKKLKLSNIKSWMSAALTDYQTCSNGLDEEDVSSFVKTNIKKSMESSSMYTRITIDLILKIQ